MIGNDKELKINRKGDIVTISFPISIWVLISNGILLFILGVQFFYVGNIVSIIGMAIFGSSLILVLCKRLIIDLGKERVTYFSFFKTSFQFSEVVGIFSEVKGGGSDGSYSNNYYIIIESTKKRVRISVQSEEQMNKVLTTLSAYVG